MDATVGAWVCAAYLAGSVPFGLLIGRAHGIDIRAHGSKNIGATNVGRVLGRRAGIACFALDMLKGFVPTLLAGLALGTAGRVDPPPDASWAWLAVAGAAVAGHMFPPWLAFRGGKGVATGFGAILAVVPLLTIPAAGALVVWLGTLRVSRYVGLSSCVAAASLPLLTALQPGLLRAAGLGRAGAPGLGTVAPHLAVGAILAALVIYRHRGNLARTLRGTESRVAWIRRGTPGAPDSRDVPGRA